MRYPTYEELMAKETKEIGDKIRKCAVKVCPPERPKRCACQSYDRPIVCAEKKKSNGATLCAKFKTANIDYLQKFAGKDGNAYAFAWNKDEKKYIIYCNNKVKQKFGMANLSYAYDIYWELTDKLSEKPRRKSREATRKSATLLPLEKTILSMLTAEPTHFDKIVIATEDPIKGKVQLVLLNSVLLDMEMLGLIKRLPGDYFTTT